MWSQTNASFQTSACAATQARKTLSVFFHKQEHTDTQVSSVAMIYKRQRICPSHPDSTSNICSLAKFLATDGCGVARTWTHNLLTMSVSTVLWFLPDSDPITLGVQDIQRSGKAVSEPVNGPEEPLESDALGLASAVVCIRSGSFALFEATFPVPWLMIDSVCHTASCFKLSRKGLSLSVENIGCLNNTRHSNANGYSS